MTSLPGRAGLAGLAGLQNGGRKIILASKSPRRKELLSIITNDFTVVPSEFDEEGFSERDPILLVRILSLSKASTVEARACDIIIGCDTVVYLDDEIFGKPQDKEQAASMLSKLSGKTHRVVTGVCVLENNNIHQFESETEVTFFKLSEEEINAYIETAEPYDKAGGYGIQGRGALFVEKVNGDYQNVVGMPVSRLYRLLLDII